MLHIPLLLKEFALEDLKALLEKEERMEVKGGDPEQMERFRIS